jgi:RNA polymerase sigma factor (sigma-70 family)
MRLIPDVLNAFAAPRLAEGDPLPPDDRVAVGSVLALNDLYQTQAPRLLRYFARRADSQDAGDLVQESFARLADASAATNRTIEQPEAYLNRIATNLLRNRAKTALQRSLAQHVPVDEDSLPGPDMIAALEARDLLNRLQTALMRLSPKTRDIFLAHRVDGVSYSDIAKRMGLSVKGVEWHMTKAIAHLDRVLRAR